MNARMKFLIWWIGIPLFVAGISTFPFLFLRCIVYPVEGVACWRIPTVGTIVFDIWAYLEFMGMAIVRAPGGFHLRWFEHVIRLVHFIFPEATVPELWLVLRVFFGVISWWVGSWVLCTYIRASRFFCRWSASAFWIASSLVLGFRPAGYSWYVPVGFFAVIVCVWCMEALDRGDWRRAIIWSVLPVFITTIYPWFLIFVCMWVGGIWAIYFHRFLYSRKIITGIWLGCVLLSVCGTVLAVFISKNRLVDSFRVLERNGLGYTHMIVLAAILFAGFMWLVLAIFFAGLQSSEVGRRISYLLFISWIVTLTAWCSNVLTGIYIQNDHFRFFILLFSWISVSAFVFCARDGCDMRSLFAYERWIVRGIFVFASVMTVKVIVAPYAFNGDQLNIIQFVIWSSLVIGSAVLLLPEWIRCLSNKKIACSAMCLALVIGIPPYIVFIREEAKSIPELRPYEASIAWIHENIPEFDRICSTPYEASVIGAFSGRSVFFTDQNVYDRIPDKELYKNIQTLASIVPATKEVSDAWKGSFWVQYLVCTSFDIQRKVASHFLSSDSLDRVLGCPRNFIQARDRMIDTVVLGGALASVEDVGEFCPWIAVPIEGSSSWNVPSNASLEYEDAVLRLYQIRSY